MFFSERYMSPCWCQGFQNTLGLLESGSPLDLISLYGQSGYLFGAAWGSGPMMKEWSFRGMGGRWMLPGFTMFCLWLSFRNCHLLIESNLIQHKVRMLRKENRQLLREQIALEECNIETKTLCNEGSQKIKDHYTKQQQVG